MNDDSLRAVSSTGWELRVTSMASDTWNQFDRCWISKKGCMINIKKKEEKATYLEIVFAKNLVEQIENFEFHTSHVIVVACTIGFCLLNDRIHV